MKKIKNLLLLFIGMTAMTLSFTSCNSDSSNDDYRYFTDSEEKTAQSMVAGTYNCTLKVEVPQTTGSSDSDAKKYNVAAVLRTDSTFTLRNFPISALDTALYVASSDLSTDAKTVADLRSAISNMPDEDLKCIYFIPGPRYVNNTVYSFVINVCPDWTPANTKRLSVEKKLTYGGKEHNVKFTFYLNIYGGNIDVATKKMKAFNLVLAAINVDKTDNEIDLYNYTSSLGLTSSPASAYFRPVLFTGTQE